MAPAVYADACMAVGSAMCIDPDDPLNNPNGGGLSAEEIVDICERKCPGSNNFWGSHPWHAPGDEFAGVSDGPWDGCGTIPARAAPPTPPIPGVLTGIECTPTAAGQAPFNTAYIPDTNRGFASASQAGNSATLNIQGNRANVQLETEYAFSITNCAPSANLEKCELRLSTLKAEISGFPIFGIYQLDTLTASLSGTNTTSVMFNCSSGICEGTFDFGPGNELAMDTSWDQTNTNTQSIGGGSFLIDSNTVHGELSLDASKTTGTLRMSTIASFTLGTAAGSLVANLTGVVQAAGVN